jgi:mono/diheme cytochrome c family protein
MTPASPWSRYLMLAVVTYASGLANGCSSSSGNSDGSAVSDSGGSDGESGEGGSLPGSSGPADSTFKRFESARGDVTLGRDVFRFETFGNEGFWTRVLQLPQGFKELNTLQALALGLSIDSEMLPAELASKMAAEFQSDLTVENAPTLNSPAAFEAVVEASALIGFPARNVVARNGKLDINDTDVYAGESLGMSCALCHSVTDGSLHKPAAGVRAGTIGKRIDASGNHDLEFGKTVALGKGSRAFYPTLALALVANMGKSVSRKGPGIGLISAAGTEAEVDAYLNDSALYPIGMFDDLVDGNGAPMHNTAFFRTTLSAPWGSEGSIHFLDNFSNNVYTQLMDPTDIATEGGKKFLMERGMAAGLEIVTNYEAILASMGVPKGGQNGYPFTARATRLVNGVATPTGVLVGLSAGAKIEESPLGIRVDDAKAIAMNGYLDTVKSFPGDKSDPQAIARGRLIFRTECTTCHRDDQSVFVPSNIHPYNPSVELYNNEPRRPDLFPGYTGELVADRAAVGLAPVRNAPGTFDDKLIIGDPSNKDDPRGSALPLLVDLARKPTFLHDDSVASLDELLDPASRSASVPHPFFVAEPARRSDVVKFLRSLDDQPLK